MIIGIFIAAFGAILALGNRWIFDSDISRTAAHLFGTLAFVGGGFFASQSVSGSPEALDNAQSIFYGFIFLFLGAMLLIGMPNVSWSKISLEDHLHNVRKMRYIAPFALLIGGYQIYRVAQPASLPLNFNALVALMLIISIGLIIFGLVLSLKPEKMRLGMRGEVSATSLMVMRIVGIVTTASGLFGARLAFLFSQVP